MSKFLLSTLALAAALASGGSALAQTRSGVDQSGFDPAVRVQDDLFRAVNGQWLNKTEIPADKPRYGTFIQLRDKSDREVRAIVERLAGQQHKGGSVEQKIGDYYKTYTDLAALDALGVKPVQPLLAEVDAMGRRGLRVLAVADARWHGDAALPPSMRDFDFGWRGLVAFADPLREGVVEAVAEAHAAGIRVVMLTGDHPATARAIAAQAGIAAGTRGVVEGHPLEAMDDDALLRCATGSNVFARVRPEQKLRLVAAFKRDGQVVAMTGDGVNDAPALMSAHVGIAMGQRGTDVAREAAAIVLLDDDFVTVVRAIRLGRTIYDNIRRAVHYILAVHVPIAGLALLPLVGGGPLVLLPLHVVFLELIIDPACSIVF